MPRDTTPASWRGEVVPGVFEVVSEGLVTSLPGFSEGGWWVQDLASVLVTDLVPVRPGMSVLDACAAPGGKTFRLGSRGAVVSAVDRDEVRLPGSARCRQLGLKSRPGSTTGRSSDRVPEERPANVRSVLSMRRAQESDRPRTRRSRASTEPECTARGLRSGHPVSAQHVSPVVARGRGLQAVRGGGAVVAGSLRPPSVRARGGVVDGPPSEGGRTLSGKVEEDRVTTRC